MATFRDKAGRTIEIEIDDWCAYARHDGKKIGDLITTGPIEIDDRQNSQPAEITGWNVHDDYQRAGIATELVRQLVAEIGVLAPAKRDEGVGGQNALTPEGHALTVHCQNLGLIYPYPEETPDEWDQE